MFNLGEGDILNPEKTGAFVIDAAEEAVVKIKVTDGTITVKNVIFKY